MAAAISLLIVVTASILIVYGRSDALEALDERRRDCTEQEEHAKAPKEQHKIVEQQAREDSESRREKNESLRKTA